MKNQISPNSKLDTRSVEDTLARIESNEHIARDSAGDEVGEAYDGGGWAGDGSGIDDLADYNANEADDYRNEDLYTD